MALKDLSTNEAADILVQLAPLMDNIVSDEKIMERIGKAVDTSEMTTAGRYSASIHKVLSCVPLLLVDHREDVFGIVAAVKRKDISEIAGQPITQTMADIKQIVEDEDLRSFFSSFAA